MESTISGTRSDDSTRLKIQIGKYAALDPARHPVSPPIDDGSGRRTHMGMNHPVLARFLCPIGEIERFNEDPKGYVLFACAIIGINIDFTLEQSNACKAVESN